MTTTIENNGNTIKITIGTQVRDVTKSQIEEVEVIKTNIIRVDIGRGPLGNIFIPFADVTLPLTTTPDLLKAAINDMRSVVTGGSAAGSATEVKQDNEIAILTTLNSAIDALKTTTATIDGKLFYEPLLVDNSGSGIIYKGFAVVGTAQNSKLWAIQRISQEHEVDVYTWAAGNKEFVNTWTDRETLTYL